MASNIDTGEPEVAGGDQPSRLDALHNTPELLEETFEIFRERENKFLVKDYMSTQDDIDKEARAIVVDWLVDVQVAFQAPIEVLYRAVRYMDHYLSKKPVTKDRLQLVGVTALFMSYKFEDSDVPTLVHFLYICDGEYTRTELTEMEWGIMDAVKWELHMPISRDFVWKFAKTSEVSKAVLYLGYYISEMALMAYELVSTKESLIAASCLYLAMMMLEPGAKWDRKLEEDSKYTEKDLKSTVEMLNNMLHNKDPMLVNITNKYSQPEFLEVAKTPLLSTRDCSPATSPGQRRARRQNVAAAKVGK